MSSPNSFYVSFDKDNDCCVLDSETQTSKTILQLAADEILSYSRSPSPTKCQSPPSSPPSQVAQSPTKGSSVETSPRKQRRAFLNQTSPFTKTNRLKKKKDDKNHYKKINLDDTTVLFKSNQWKNSSQESQESFDLNDILTKLVSNENVSIPELSQFIITSINIKIVPKPDKDNPPESPSSFETFSDVETKLKNNVPEQTASSENEVEYEIDPNQINMINNLIANLKHPMWNTQLEALRAIMMLSRNYPAEHFISHMPVINHAVIQLLQSPRSAVCRACCKIAGELFTTISFVHRPEFDDIVELLLNKTADVNRFIKNDANFALDSMVTSIAPFHAIRVLFKGTKHKNDLVRITASRLLVQIVSINGQELILSHNSNEFTRKRMLTSMLNFKTDKNGQVRQNGNKLYRMLNFHPNFEMFLKKLSDSKFHYRRKNE